MEQLSEDEIKWLNVNYPELSYLKKWNILEGKLNINRIYNEIPIKDSYDIHIDLNANDNNKETILPKIFEVGGKIQKNAKSLDIKNLVDLHVNTDSSLCCCIYENEKIYFLEGFNIKVYLKDIVEPFLYWQSYYMEYGEPPWEDYSHGFLGYLELYANSGIKLKEIMGMTGKEALKKLSKLKGGHNCICGSKLKMRDCHSFVLEAIYKLKKELK